MRLFLIIAATVFLFPEITYSEIKIVDHEIRISSPLYIAKIDCDRRMLKWIEYTVFPEDVNGETTKNDFTSLDNLKPYSLEEDDYLYSGFDRGHTRPRHLTRSHPDADDINNTAIIVPQTPNLNRITLRSFEDHIYELAKSKKVRVLIVCEFSDSKTHILPKADEPYQVPVSFVYFLRYENQYQAYRFPNIKNPNPDWKRYRLFSMRKEFDDDTTHSSDP